MECLRLGPGLSFLNIGSGTGYLSTMVGLILGSLGVNHGVEIHADLLEYAQQKLVEAKTIMPVLNSFNFCEPIFIKGNGLACRLAEDSCRYDRVYCGAACPPIFKNRVKNLIKVGGVLVMPFDDLLLRITRISETQWEEKIIMRVVFSSLLVPSTAEEESAIKLPKINVQLPPPMSPVSVQQNAAEQHKGKSQTNNKMKNSPKDSKIIVVLHSSSEEDVSGEVTEKGIDGCLSTAHCCEHRVNRRSCAVKRSETKNSVSENINFDKSELFENIKQITERLQELSECPVCFNAMDSTSFQCFNGHGICSVCARRVDKCPTCKREFVVYKSTLLGKIFECLPKMCPYIDKGCSVITLDKDHENFCKFRTSACRNLLCEWSGCVRDLIDHVRKCGKRKVREISQNSKVPCYFPIERTQNVTLYTPIIFHNQLFWEHFHRDVTKKRITYRFHHVPTSKPTLSYYFKVSFEKGNISYVNCFRAVVEEKNDTQCIDDTGIGFPDKELERFRSTKENDMYEYSVQVVTEDND